MVDRPDWDGSGDAAPDASPPATVPKASGITRPDWGGQGDAMAPADPSWEATPQEEIVAGVGYAPSLIEKLKRQPDGFEANDARLVNAVVDLLEHPDTPADLEAAFDTWPVSLQTKCLEERWAHPTSTLEQHRANLKGKLTLIEARAVDAWARKLRGA